MANEKNLNPPIRSASEAREKGKKGGIKSGETRREKSTVRKILNDYLAESISKKESLKELADKLGIKKSGNIKQLFVIACTVNSLKYGNLNDLEKLVGLLGEDEDNKNDDVINKLDNVLKDIDGVMSDEQA